MLVPQYPQEGVHLVNVDVRSRITNTSCFLNNISQVPVTSFIVMSTTQLPSGEYVVDKLHPSTSSLAVSSCECVYENSNIGHTISKALRAWLNTQQQQQREEYKWSVPVYDQQTYRLYNLPAFAVTSKNEIVQIVKQIVQQMVQQEVEFSAVEIVANGTSEVSFSAGMELVRLQPVRDTFRVSFQNLPIEAAPEFKIWLLGPGLVSSDIQWIRAYPPLEARGIGWTGTVVLRSKAAVDFILEKHATFLKVLLPRLSIHLLHLRRHRNRII